MLHYFFLLFRLGKLLMYFRTGVVVVDAYLERGFMDETRLGLVRPLLSESEKSTSGEVMIGVGPDPFEYDPAPSSSRTSSTSTDSPVPNWMLGEVLLEAGSVTVMTAVRKEARQSFSSS